MIELKDFCKSYSLSSKNSFAVQNVNLKAEDGKITCLIGPNGSGKTTIINGIAGNHAATKGSVSIYDENKILADPVKDFEKARKMTGFVPEIPFLPKDRTVIEILFDTADERGLSEKEKTAEVIKIIEKCSLKKVLKSKIQTLSKGFSQRLSFAIALIGNPSNLVLDEPMYGLDPAQIVQFRKLIKESSMGKAVLMTTHLMQEVSAMADEIYIISCGTIKAFGSVDNILKETASKTIEEAYIKITGEADESIR